MAEEATNEHEVKKVHPSTERIKHLRHQINERIPGARRVFEKSGTEHPTERQLINSAGDKLRTELESDIDLLTGVFGKRGYEKSVAMVAAKAREDNQEAAVAVIDLDGLKVTNDTFGHSAGDKYLKDAADALREASRDTDIVGRVGGDEFHIFLVNTNSELAKAWKKRVNEKLEERGVRASIGLSPVDLNNIEGSVKKADKKMYVEKRKRKTVSAA
jgi:diguanylate cyclase (GGDEF)-like protein